MPLEVIRMLLNDLLLAIVELVLMAVIFGAALSECGPEDEELLEMLEAENDGEMMYQ